MARARFFGIASTVPFPTRSGSPIMSVSARVGRKYARYDHSVIIYRDHIDRSADFPLKGAVIASKDANPRRLHATAWSN
jgi:hypothetical protein